MTQKSDTQQTILSVYKPAGLTPLEAIKLLQTQLPQYDTKSIGYAGRLDPMAEGVLLLLVGAENRRRKEYELLDKEYRFTMLPGISTDSYDCLGMITSTAHVPLTEDFTDKAQSILTGFIGKSVQSYPPYSAPRVRGKPLFYWARHNLLHTIKIPKKEIEIYSAHVENFQTVPKDELVDTIDRLVQRVHGDFRQEEIRQSWKKYFRSTSRQQFQLLSGSIQTSSGTYIRSIVHDLGIKLGCGATTYSLIRTRVGTYTDNAAIRIDTPSV